MGKRKELKLMASSRGQSYLSCRISKRLQDLSFEMCFSWPVQDHTKIHQTFNLKMYWKKVQILLKKTWRIIILPFWLKYCLDFLPEKANCNGRGPSSSMIWAMWSEETHIFPYFTEIHHLPPALNSSSPDYSSCLAPHTLQLGSVKLPCSLSVSLEQISN